MPVVNLATQKVGKPGGSELTASYTAIATANTYTFKNTRRTLLHIKKSGASVAVITFITPAAPGGFAVTDPTISVPATTGDEFVSCAALPAVFNAGDGLVTFSTDNETGLTAAVLEVD